MSKSERLLLWSTAALTLVLRALALFRYRFDSDEQQHLHVTWGWTAGLVQYRDFFDNHTPLFHLLTAPILVLIGERSDVLLWMRAPMLVLFAAVLWGTFVLARRLYDARVALWATVLLALFPLFFLKSLEFRNDNLWTAVSIAALVVLTTSPLDRRRSFFLGLILGFAMAVSAKTMLLVAAIVIAGAITLFFARPATPGFRRTAAIVLAFCGGLAVVPAAVAIAFLSFDALDDLVHCAFVFNSRPIVSRSPWVGIAAFPFTSAVLVWLAWKFRRTEHVWRYYLATLTGVFVVIIAALWIPISPRDFLPLMPIGAIFAAATIVRFRHPVRSFAAVAVACFVALWYYADRFENNTDWHTTMMDQALRLSHPGEPLIDLKGETIFRQRPFYYVFENLTRAQIARGVIRDTLPEDVIRTRTHVAQADGPMWSPRARAFLSENFVNLGRLRASGQWIRDDGTFTIAVPGEYVVLNDRGEARGLLDGTPYTGARGLAPGGHRFVGEKNVCVLWAPAFRRGHSPYHLRDLDF